MGMAHVLHGYGIILMESQFPLFLETYDLADKQVSAVVYG